MSPRAPLWAGYRAATALLERSAPAFLRWRLGRGKEDAARLPERLGHAVLPRPAGPLVWLHGASVGEALALLPLIERLRATGLAVLLTTGTLSSAAVMAARLPAGALHQFVPLDGPAAARRFLDHWRPDLVLFAESELWPNLLGAARRRGIPVGLVNARMSPRSFGRWRRLPALARPLIGSLATVLAQSEADANRYRLLGAGSVLTVGNLKYDADPPPADPSSLEALRAAIGDRPVWVAASTQPGEDLACLAVQAALKGRRPGLLLVIVPRHVERGGPIEGEATRLGLAAAVRSRGQPVTAATDVHVADTMGELGLFYRLTAPVFMGKSLGPQGGGQNPIEPAKLGNAVLHGPAIDNFRDVYAGLDAAGGARPVTDAATLQAALDALLSAPKDCAALAAAARTAVTVASGAADRTMAALAPILPLAPGAAR